MPDIIKAGDRVRITIEGIADEVLAGESYGEHPEPRGFDARSSEGDKVTIEKIEPPVEVFKSGDRIRRRLDDGWSSPYEVTLADDGYLMHYTDGSTSWTPGATTFDSGAYERVNFDSPAR